MVVRWNVQAGDPTPPRF